MALKKIGFNEMGNIPGLKVEVEADDFNVGFKFENKTKDAIQVELTGGVLQPASDMYQRLLVIGSAEDEVDRNATHVGPGKDEGEYVLLNPGQEARVKLSTVCMDRPKAPPSGNEYGIGKKLAPPKLVEAAREFVRHRALRRIRMPHKEPAHKSISDVQATSWGLKPGEL